MADSPDTHFLRTPNAGATLALGAFAGFGEGMMLAGGSLLYGGAAVALLFSCLIAGLHWEEFGALKRDLGAARHLILPLVVIGILVLAAVIILYRKLSDHPLTLGQFAAAAFSSGLAGGWQLIMNVETWFVIFALCTFAIVYPQRRLQPPAPKPELGPEVEAALAKLKAQIDQGRSGRAASPDPGPSFLEKWRPIDPLTLGQAACLWNEEPPTSAVHLRGDARARYIMLMQALQSGKMVSTRVQAGERYSDTKPGPMTQISRDELRKFAESDGQRPRFLFLEAETTPVSDLRSTTQQLADLKREIAAPKANLATPEKAVVRAPLGGVVAASPTRPSPALAQWSKATSYQLFEAASLWVGEIPPINAMAAASDEAQAVLARLRAAVFDGLLGPVGPSGLDVIAAQIGGKPTVPATTRATRDKLIDFARSQNEKPSFLFPQG